MSAPIIGQIMGNNGEFAGQLGLLERNLCWSQIISGQVGPLGTIYQGAKDTPGMALINGE